jgi:hypothetical protein
MYGSKREMEMSMRDNKAKMQARSRLFLGQDAGRGLVLLVWCVCVGQKEIMAEKK